MLKSACLAVQDRFSGTFEFDIPLSKVVYYRIGGPACVLATPRTFKDLEILHALIQETKTRYFILGWGSNLLFSDETYPGLVIRMKHLLSEISEVGQGVLKLGASLGASRLLKKACEQGYGGLAKLTGIPGSVGGMVAMNAGTYLGEFGASLIKTEFVNLEKPGELEVQTRIHESADFSYRQNHFLKPGDLITHTFCRYTPGRSDEIKAEIDALYLRRKASQPVNYPSCGSVFMNPRESGLHAWQVIDQLKLRGHQIGQAQISEKHPNFIVNLGGAKAVDVKALIELVKARASAELAISLHEVVRVIE